MIQWWWWLFFSIWNTTIENYNEIQFEKSSLVFQTIDDDYIYDDRVLFTGHDYRAFKILVICFVYYRAEKTRFDLFSCLFVCFMMMIIIIICSKINDELIIILLLLLLYNEYLLFHKNHAKKKKFQSKLTEQKKWNENLTFVWIMIILNSNDENFFIIVHQTDGSQNS